MDRLQLNVQQIYAQELSYKDNMSSKWLDNNLIDIAKADIYLRQHAV